MQRQQTFVFGCPGDRIGNPDRPDIVRCGRGDIEERGVSEA
jgi:hypothetical protein